jgi:transposase-like protein
MELTTCPQCGSKQIQHEIIKDVILNKPTIDYRCKVCGYHCTPLLLEKYEGIFQGIKPEVPGFIGPWAIHTRLDNGERKTLSVLWEDARDCIRSLGLKKGDRITVTVDQEIWCIDKVTDAQ